MPENIMNTPLRNYPRLTDEELYEIMEKFAYGPHRETPNPPADIRYKYAYEIMQLRENKNLVAETARLVRWTLGVAIGTIIVAMATVAVALITYIAKEI